MIAGATLIGVSLQMRSDRPLAFRAEDKTSI
jgi:hypothetical protein